MAVTLYQDRNYNGASLNLTGDMADLAGTGVDRPSSISLSTATDAVLLFKNDEWRGGVHYLREARSVSDLGRFNVGGRNTFRNSVRSVRITPFTLPLNIAVVTDSDGNLPGSWATEEAAEADINTIVATINSWYADQLALLALDIEQIEFHSDDRRFDMPRRRTMPRNWRVRGEVDLMFINRFASEGTLGNSRFPCTGQRSAIAKTVDDGTNIIELTPAFLAVTVAHELGHYLGLTHRTGRGLQENLMFPGGDPSSDTLASQELQPAQIREMHQRLARNVARRGDRRD